MFSADVARSHRGPDREPRRFFCGTGCGSPPPDHARRGAASVGWRRPAVLGGLDAALRSAVDPRGQARPADLGPGGVDPCRIDLQAALVANAAKYPGGFYNLCQTWPTSGATRSSGRTTSPPRSVRPRALPRSRLGDGRAPARDHAAVPVGAERSTLARPPGPPRAGPGRRPGSASLPGPVPGQGTGPLRQRRPGADTYVIFITTGLACRKSCASCLVRWTDGDKEDLMSDYQRVRRRRSGRERRRLHDGGIARARRGAGRSGGAATRSGRLQDDVHPLHRAERNAGDRAARAGRADRGRRWRSQRRRALDSVRVDPSPVGRGVSPIPATAMTSGARSSTRWCASWRPRPRASR